MNHRQSLIRTIFRIVGCPQTAEDLAQDAYPKLLHAAETQEISYPRPFLYQIASNLALDHLRKQQVRQSVDETANDDEYNDNPLDRIPGNTPTPEQQSKS